MFNTSSIVLGNSFNTLSPFIDALVNKMSETVCSTQPPQQVSVGQRSQISIASKLFINFVSMCHHKNAHRIGSCIEQLIVN